MSVDKDIVFIICLAKKTKDVKQMFAIHPLLLFAQACNTYVDEVITIVDKYFRNN